MAVDTHALLFYASNNLKRLGRRARRVFELYEEERTAIWVPVPVLLEVSFLHRGREVDLGKSLRAWWTELRNPFLKSIELIEDDVFQAAELDWSHRDPFDRLIVAMALRVGTPLMTHDGAIADWGGVETIWS